MKPDLEGYFEEIQEKAKKVYAIAQKAREKGYDPERKVDIPIAKNMAERVIRLVSAVAPQLSEQEVINKIITRIKELEKEYGILDWRVSLKIAEEIAKEKFCRFESKLEAAEAGIRTGFAYHTLGTVASPLEGFTGIKVRKRADGKEYWALFFSGPIRSAGGTGASVCVLIADYVRKKLNVQPYDPTEEEIQRMVTEVHDFHN
ncbi:DNA polymerase II large subunit, partial [Candidatus Woesearchaeota archaeon]